MFLVKRKCSLKKDVMENFLFQGVGCLKFQVLKNVELKMGLVINV